MELADEFGSYKDDKIHDIHSFVGELNADVMQYSDPFLMPI